MTTPKIDVTKTSDKPQGGAISAPITEVIRVSGNPQDRGHVYGAKFKTQIEKNLEELFSSFKREKNWQRERLLLEGRKYIPFIEEYIPEIAEEIKGIATGAGRGYDEIVSYISYYELGEDIPGLCTCFGVTGKATTNGETYIGQNWDGGIPIHGFMLHVERETGPNVLTFTDYGFPAGYGVNSEGISVVWNSVHCEKAQFGVPAYLLVREVLHQKLLSDVIDRLTTIERAESINFIIADKHGEVYNFEATPDDYDLTYCEDTIVHANHFVSNNLNIERDLIREKNSGTVIRHNRMTKLINQKCGRIDLETAMKFQQDHANYPKSICTHMPAGATCSSAVIIPEKQEIHVSFGNPCENPYHKYTCD